MSSESEDEFQSADEGSDLEDLECNTNASVHQQPSPVHVAPCERVHETEEDETRTEAVKEKLNKDILNVKAVDTKADIKDASERTEIIKEFEKSEPVDVLCISKDDNVSASVSCIQGDESLKEQSVNEPQVAKSPEDNILQEVCERSSSCMEELQRERILQESQRKTDDKSLAREIISDVQSDEAQPKEVIKNSEEKSGNTECKSKVLSSQADSSENSKTENAAVEIEAPAPASKPKPLRQSKIGMKKPREKLGERLGARKLGTKAATKSTDSISSSDVVKHKGEDKIASPDEGRRESTTKSVEENREVEDEKMKKRQQWEEQQERWQQALNLDTGRKEASSKDGDGWSAPWGGWGDTLLSAASTFTREVGRGVGTVMETVESSIGVPSPEVMAQEVCKSEYHQAVSEKGTTPPGGGEAKETKIEKETEIEESSVGGGRSGQQAEGSYGLGGFSLGSLVSGVSGALETASSKVLMGGLDTLEVIGRKAMDVIQDGDPGLRRKRAFLSNKKPNLAQVLQEARQRAIEEERDGVFGGGNNKNLQKPSFEVAWEATEGPVHLEALSLVAKQCQSKKASMIATLPHYAQEKLLRENNIIKTTCEVDELEQLEGELPELVPDILLKMGLHLHPQKLLEAWSSVQEKAAFIQEVGFEAMDEAESELYGTMAQFVAQLCALAHKGGELALITPETDPIDLASNFKELAQAVSCGLENVADRVCGSITTQDSVDDHQGSNTITNIYLQAASGNNYIQESLELLASVLQYSNTKSAAAHH